MTADRTEAAPDEYDVDGNLIRWTCGACGERTTVRHGCCWPGREPLEVDR